MIKKIFNKKHIFPVALLLLLLSVLKLVDNGIGGFSNLFKSSEPVATYTSDSAKLEYDTLFNSIDKNIEVLVKSRNGASSEKEIKKLISDVKIITPLSSLPKRGPSNTQNVVAVIDGPKYVERKKFIFYLVTSPGFVTNGRGAVDYYLPGGANGRYYYEIDLKEGIYSFITTGINPRDTTPFIIDKTGVYKLGFQEDHPNFMIFKDSLP